MNEQKKEAAAQWWRIAKIWNLMKWILDPAYD